MLTAAQIKDIAKQNKTTPYYQEKDYIQNIFLFGLFRESQDLVFKGGTCLKIAYGHQRFSEDLDFNSTSDSKRLRDIIADSLKNFNLLGIEHEFIKEELFEDSYTSKIRFQGPLYTGRTESTNSIQLDIGKRDGVVLKPRWVQVTPPYPDVPKYFVMAMEQEEILAEKIRAMTMRSEPKDLFDVWGLLSAGIKPDEKLLRKKISKKIKLKFCSRVEYERSLKNLLPVLPPHEQMVNDVKDKLRNL